MLGLLLTIIINLRIIKEKMTYLIQIQSYFIDDKNIFSNLIQRNKIKIYLVHL